MEVMGQWESSFLVLPLYFCIWAVPGPRCCAGVSLAVGRESPLQEWCPGFSLRWLPCAHGLWGARAGQLLPGSKHRLSHRSARASLLGGMWTLPRPGIESILHRQVDSLSLSHQGSPRKSTSNLMLGFLLFVLKLLRARLTGSLSTPRGFSEESTLLQKHYTQECSALLCSVLLLTSRLSPVSCPSWLLGVLFPR